MVSGSRSPIFVETVRHDSTAPLSAAVRGPSRNKKMGKVQGVHWDANECNTWQRWSGRRNAKIAMAVDFTVLQARDLQTHACRREGWIDGRSALKPEAGSWDLSSWGERTSRRPGGACSESHLRFPVGQLQLPLPACAHPLSMLHPIGLQCVKSRPPGLIL